MAASLGRLGYFTEYMQEIDIKFALNPKLKKHLGLDDYLLVLAKWNNATHKWNNVTNYHSYHNILYHFFVLELLLIILS